MNNNRDSLVVGFVLPSYWYLCVSLVRRKSRTHAPTIHVQTFVSEPRRDLLTCGREVRVNKPYSDREVCTQRPKHKRKETTLARARVFVGKYTTCVYVYVVKTQTYVAPRCPERSSYRSRSTPLPPSSTLSLSSSLRTLTLVQSVHAAQSPPPLVAQHRRFVYNRF